MQVHNTLTLIQFSSLSFHFFFRWKKRLKASPDVNTVHDTVRARGTIKINRNA